jgi:hypothetical protein
MTGSRVAADARWQLNMQVLHTVLVKAVGS